MPIQILKVLRWDNKLIPPLTRGAGVVRALELLIRIFVSMIRDLYLDNALTIRSSVLFSDFRFLGYCQMLWMRFDSGGVIYLDPVNEFGSRNYSLEMSGSV